MADIAHFLNFFLCEDPGESFVHRRFLFRVPRCRRPVESSFGILREATLKSNYLLVRCFPRSFYSKIF